MSSFIGYCIKIRLSQFIARNMKRKNVWNYFVRKSKGPEKCIMCGGLSTSRHFLILSNITQMWVPKLPEKISKSVSYLIEIFSMNWDTQFWGKVSQIRMHFSLSNRVSQSSNALTPVVKEVLLWRMYSVISTSTYSILHRQYTLDDCDDQYRIGATVSMCTEV